MELFFRKIGEGLPFVVLHGVFGSSDNLFTVCKKIAESGYCVYMLDARNHGQSPRSEDFNYDVMADDLNEFLVTQKIQSPIIMGHSMGGKTVMTFAQKYDNFSKIIIVDIAPRFYPTHHNHILAGLNAINVNTLENRKDAEDIFANYVSDFGERQFILKNLYRTDEGGFDWRINIPVITKEIYQVGGEVLLEKRIEKPALVIRGADSSYVSDADFQSFKNSFVNAELVTIVGANHWVHAIKPIEFVAAILEFSK
ncbi:alpha/beta fold hydrolase [Lacihabitans sp. LS3-19]|uniref:alpha/beta fold hydrolase n=1 Tax=Lacihabitans sp. LS3-19 TaxID=2487335 RepID=UPI0020CE3D12|nr:alpha/beta fold hydrolase [Lacihabitans sp. LS3-19]MCP9768695.1 alpha/beta fold hydrolase [Lacihabitans sp. LS3-19]